MKVYQVFHLYDVDGGFGDAVGQSEVIASFENKDDAIALCERLRNEHVYDKPYADLWCGCLAVEEFDIVSHKDFSIDNYKPEDFWWMD